MKRTFLVLVLSISLASVLKAQSPTYKKEVDSLLNLMTLDEKLGQMTQRCFSTITLDGSKTLALNPEIFKDAIVKNHVGSFLSGTGSVKEWIEFVTQVQKIAIEEGRLGIPLIIGIDHVHGANFVNEGTIFPHNLTLSCSYNPLLMKKGAQVVARETAPLGLSWNFAPVLDVGKNVYWPRLYETFGEDPLVCSTMGRAFVEGYQNCKEIAPYKLAACAKHFIGYSDPKSGWDRAAAEIPDQTLYEFFVPPFQNAIDAGIKTVMVNSGEVNGEAVHASKFYLDELLRKRLGFDGVVITDIVDIKKLVEMHGAAANFKDATEMALNAGIDMSMSCGDVRFELTVKELIAEGKITEKRIDESVRRILRLKYDLNLFESSYPDAKMASSIGGKENLQVVKEITSESVVMLKNEGVLPLKKGSKILLGGFAANSRRMMNGPWTLEWLGAEEEARHRQDVPTMFGSMQNTFGKRNVFLADNDLEKFIKQADEVDVIVLAVGEEPYSEFKGNVSNLDFNNENRSLIDAAIATGKPVVLVLVVGRPLLVSEFEAQTKAILFTGYMAHGVETISDILAGKTNPSGKLSFTYPKDHGCTLPYYYKLSQYYHDNRKDFSVQYPFGHGLSYTNFTYSNLTVSDTIITDIKNPILFTVDVSNTGKVDGKETVLWFVQDEVGTITRPVKMLKHFDKKEIKAGAKCKCTFEIIPERDLTFPNKNGEKLLESGYFTVFVGDQIKKFKLNLK